MLASLTSARLVVLTMGSGGVMALNEGQLHTQTAYPTNIVDRIGAGDAMAAGVIHGWLQGNVPLGLRYGALLAALALAQRGDMVITDAEELEALLKDDTAQIVR